MLPNPMISLFLSNVAADISQTSLFKRHNEINRSASRMLMQADTIYNSCNTVCIWVGMNVNDDKMFFHITVRIPKLTHSLFAFHSPRIPVSFRLLVTRHSSSLSQILCHPYGIIETKQLGDCIRL